jgi:hypothetical protein
MACQRYLFPASLLVCVFSILSPNIGAQAVSATEPAARYLEAPLSFEANQGQADRAGQYLSRGEGYSLALSPSGVALRLRNRKDKQAREADVFMTLFSSNHKAAMVGEELQRGKTNYLIGNDRSRWVTNVSNYGSVRYQSVYPGTDLVFYGNQGHLEYDFRLQSGADPRNIQFLIDGAKPSVGEEGDLILATPAGNVRWKKPVAYQWIEGKKREVIAAYQLSDAKVSFAVGPYDHTKPLVIDPPLVWGSFLGGSGFDSPGQVQVDAAGELVIAGYTQLGWFPTTSGAVDRTPDGTYNCFVTKFSPDGQSLIYSTLVGGTQNNGQGTQCGQMGLDTEGNAYVTGTTTQSDFPYTSGSYRYVNSNLGGPFLFKLNPTGADLIYSLGAVSSGPVTVDSEGAAYVAGYWGYVPPAPYPFTPGAYRNQFDPGRYYVSVIKYNPAGTALDYAALIGSSGNQSAYAIAVDSAGEATITGAVDPNGGSILYPVTAGEPNTSGAGALVTKFNSAGTGLLYSAILATAAGNGIASDAAGDVTVVGIAGTELPTTPNAYEPKFPSSGTAIHQGFMTQMNSGGAITYSTYLGGNAPSDTAEYAWSTALEGTGGIVDIVGSKQSDTFPITDKTYYSTECGYLMRLNPALSGAAGLLYSGCVSTNTDPNPNTISRNYGTVASSGEGKVYLTFVNSGPTMMDAYQPFSNFSTGAAWGNSAEEAWVGEMEFAQPPAPQSVIVSSPPNGTDYTLPVHYVATATSTCKAGVAAMGIYTAPGVLAYSTSGHQLNTTITFKPGIYDTVVQEWDNCGGAEKTPISVRVQPGGVAVTSPANNSTVSSPVNFVANATSPNCPLGFSGMVIYSAPGVVAYRTQGYPTNTINANVSLSAGKYNVVVQAFDNCNNIFQTPLTITVQ